MRKTIAFFLTTLAIAAVVSCKPDAQPNGGGGEGGPSTLTFSASLTAYSNGPQVAWAAGDEIAVFSGTQKTVLKASAAGSSASFSGEVGAAPYYAVSPASAASTISASSVSITVPQEQTAVKDGISPAASIAVATTSGKDLAFKNALALIKVSLVSGKNIKSVTLTSKGSEKLAGSATVDVSRNKVTADGGSASVVLSGTGILETGSYYIAVIPATFVDGLDITVADEFGRVSSSVSDEFIVAKAGAVLDLGNVDEGADFSTPTILSTPYDLGFAGNGETLHASVASAFSSVSSTEKQEWLTVAVNGTDIAVTAAANTDKNARYGRVEIEGVTAAGPARVVIPVAQAATGMKIAYDSFSSPELSGNWKGNKVRADVQYGNGYLQVVGTGDYKTANPLFWYGNKVRLKYSGESCNTWICSIDCSSGSGGLWMFNQHGYEGDSYDLTSTDKPCYVCFLPFNAGETTGGFYCFNMISANAMDNWSSIHGDVINDWVRLIITNIDYDDQRGEGEKLVHEIHGNWAAAHVFNLKEENGVLVPDQLLFTKELWWWNDSVTLGTDYGYFGVFAKDPAPTKIRNFTLQYTDKQ